MHYETMFIKGNKDHNCHANEEKDEQAREKTGTAFGNNDKTDEEILKGV